MHTYLRHIFEQILYSLFYAICYEIYTLERDESDVRDLWESLKSLTSLISLINVAWSKTTISAIIL